MKEIQKQFKTLQEKFINLGDYIILTKLVSGKNYSEDFLSKLLSKLVSKDDYERGDKVLFLKHLSKLSK
jgi:hypothetical protein